MCLRYNEFSVFVKKERIKKYNHNIYCCFIFQVSKFWLLFLNFSKNALVYQFPCVHFYLFLLFTLLISQKMYSIDKQVNLSYGFLSFLSKLSLYIKLIA